MRKVKNKAAASMARLRWKKLSAEERSAQVMPAALAAGRSHRRRAEERRKAAREAEALLQPETVEA